MQPVGTASGVSLDAVPAACGAVAVGCSDVAGLVLSVIDTSQRLRSEHRALQETVTALEGDQDRVSQSSEESRLLSEQAIGRLAEGAVQIETSLGRIDGMLDLVAALSSHVTGFAAAIEQVHRCSKDIGRIADTTNILALNATIEAMRAGETGKTFAIVADEVKGLALETRRATDEISKTIETLAGEAGTVIEQIETGAGASEAAKVSIANIRGTVSGVTELVREVDQQNETIARTTAIIGDRVDRVRTVTESFGAAAERNEHELVQANERVGSLELVACDMFDSVVRAGLSPADSLMVEIGKGFAARIGEAAEQALADGTLSSAALFDHDYREIAGSNPPRFRTPLMDWAQEHWRPLLDAAKAANPRIVAAVCIDANGYLPTHMTHTSQEPTGEVQRDTQNCRHGRLFPSAMNLKAARTESDYIMSVYRREDVHTGYAVMRSVYVPLDLAGRRWGVFQISYLENGVA